MSGFPSESRAPARASFGTNTGELTSGLLGKVFGLLTFCFAFAAAGGVFSTQLGTGWFLPLFIAQIALTFAVTAARDADRPAILFQVTRDGATLFVAVAL